MVQCLSSSQVLLFLDRRLSAHELANAEAHLNRCAACRQVVAAMVSDSGEVADHSSAEPASSRQSHGAAPLVQFTRGSVIADRYLVLDELGVGASGVVYSAFDQKLDRKLALKFLRVSAYDQTEGGQSRLLREGQSLARLSHPNVVAVYDVGAFERHNYIAMELIDGRNLRQWLLEEKPDWRRTVAVFLEAARGLLAAHKAGLVHRDFKPDNVLIARDGHVCVSDFGLSHMLSVAADPLAGPGLSAAELPAASLPSTIAGTPAYMAPEQYRGQQLDGRADQFSFCAALYEALYGVRPFAGNTAEELMQAVCSGKVRAPPRGLRVPLFLHHAVLRGLRPLPHERYDSMDRLCDVLSRGPQRRRLQVGAGLAVALLLMINASAWQLRPGPCQGAIARLNGVWDPGQKQSVQQSFEKTGVPYAAAALVRLRRQLDAYADSWVSEHTEACQAANVRHEISQALLDQRMGCLEQRLFELRATVGILTQADAAVVERADQLATHLRSLTDCSSAAVLSARVPPPPPESAAQVVALRQRLSEVGVLEEAGRYAQGLSQARGVALEAKALGYQPLLAETGIQLGTLEDRVGETAHAAETLRAALAEAEASQDDKAVLAAYLKLTRYSMSSKLDFKQAADYWKHAESFTARVGTDRERAELFALQALTLRHAGQFRESTHAVEQALASATRAYGPDSPQVADYLSQLARQQILLGEVATSLQNHARALALTERALGPAHPSLMPIHAGYADALARAFRYDQSIVEQRRALSIAEQLYPPTHSQRQEYLFSLIIGVVNAGYYAEGEDLIRRWLSIDGQATDHLSELVIGVYQFRAIAQRGQGQLDLAIQTLRQAMDRQAEVTDDGRLRGDTLSQLADYEREAQQLGTALLHYQQAIAIQEKVIPNQPAFGMTLTGIGKLYLARGEPRAALPYLEHAIINCEIAHEDIARRSGSQFALAQAIISTDGDRARARRLAEQSRDIWQQCGSPCSTDLAAVTQWLQENSLVGS